MKEIILLGSTGSVGENVLNVIRAFPNDFHLKAISSYGNIDLLSRQAREFSPKVIVLGNKDLYLDLKKKIPDTIKIISGEDALETICVEETSDIIFMAIAGTVALKPLFRCLEKGKTVALASKEPVVSAGSILREHMASGSSIIPVDSEHSAVMACLFGRKSGDVRVLYLTGSGGSLKDIDSKDFATLSVKDVLNHPKWDMGPKITVDSATFMNKGLEVIEARWLFDIEPDKIKVVIHPEAIIHSMVEFIDGTITANMFYPDMKFPILRALAYPGILESDFERVNLTQIGQLTFSEPDIVKFPALDLAYRVLDDGGTCPAVLNAANETAVNLFLDEKIKFTDVISKVEQVLGKHKKVEKPTLKEILDTEKWAKEEVLRSC